MGVTVGTPRAGADDLVRVRLPVDPVTVWGPAHTPLYFRKLFEKRRRESTVGHVHVRGPRSKQVERPRARVAHGVQGPALLFCALVDVGPLGFGVGICTHKLEGEEGADKAISAKPYV